MNAALTGSIAAPFGARESVDLGLLTGLAGGGLWPTRRLLSLGREGLGWGFQEMLDHALKFRVFRRI